MVVVWLLGACAADAGQVEVAFPAPVVSEVLAPAGTPTADAGSASSPAEEALPDPIGPVVPTIPAEAAPAEPSAPVETSVPATPSAPAEPSIPAERSESEPAVGMLSLQTGSWLHGDAALGCIWLSGSPTDPWLGRVPVSWPDSLTLAFDPPRLLDSSGTVLASAGDRVDVGGGGTCQLDPDACPMGEGYVFYANGVRRQSDG